MIEKGAKEQVSAINTIIAMIDFCIQNDKTANSENLQWLKANYTLTLLLDQTRRYIRPAWELRTKALQHNEPLTKDDIENAAAGLKNAPVDELIREFAVKVRSRGEVGEFSSIIQRVYSEYNMLLEFVETAR